MRELREFRAHYDEFTEQGIAVAGCSRESVESNRDWRQRLEIPFPLLSDSTGDVGRSLGIMRRVGLGSWNLELVRRVTILVDLEGMIAAVWSRVKIRGHAREVLALAHAAARPTSS